MIMNLKAKYFRNLSEGADAMKELFHLVERIKAIVINFFLTLPRILPLLFSGSVSLGRISIF